MHSNRHIVHGKAKHLLVHTTWEGRDCGIIVTCYECITHEPECLRGGIRCRRGFKKQPWTRQQGLEV